MHGRCRHLEVYAPVIVLLRGLCDVEIGDCDLALASAAKIKERSANDRVICDLGLATIFENQNGRGLIGDGRRVRLRNLSNLGLHIFAALAVVVAIISRG